MYFDLEVPIVDKELQVLYIQFLRLIYPSDYSIDDYVQITPEVIKWLNLELIKPIAEYISSIKASAQQGYAIRPEEKIKPIKIFIKGINQRFSKKLSFGVQARVNNVTHGGTKRADVNGVVFKN